MKVSELCQKSEQELKNILQQTRNKLRGLRFSIELKQSKNVRELRKVRKQIAKILTIIKEKYD